MRTPAEIGKLPELTRKLKFNSDAGKNKARAAWGDLESNVQCSISQHAIKRDDPERSCVGGERLRNEFGMARDEAAHGSAFSRLPIDDAAQGDGPFGILFATRLHYRGTELVETMREPAVPQPSGRYRPRGAEDRQGRRLFPERPVLVSPLFPARPSCRSKPARSQPRKFSNPSRFFFTANFLADSIGTAAGRKGAVSIRSCSAPISNPALAQGWAVFKVR